MKWIACALLVLSLLGALPARSSAEGPLVILPPEDIASRFYTNPSNLFDIGDPHILPAGGKYYAFATGGTVAATLEMLEHLGYPVCGTSVLFEIAGLGGREKVSDLQLHTVFSS